MSIELLQDIFCNFFHFYIFSTTAYFCLAMAFLHCQIMFVCGVVLATANNRRQGYCLRFVRVAVLFVMYQKEKGKDKHNPCNKGSLCGLPLPDSLEIKCTALSGGSRYFIV